MKRILTAIFALASATMACGQAQNSQIRAVMISAPAPSKPVASAVPVRAAASANLRAAISPSLQASIAPKLLISLRTAPVTGIDAVEEQHGYAHASEVTLYYNGAVPAELFETFRVLETTNSGFGLNLHIPGVRSMLSMGGGEVAVSGGMMSMARGAAIAEAGLNIATLDGRFGIRVQGRAITTRSQTFTTPLFSTANWVVTEKPAFSAFYHF